MRGMLNGSWNLFLSAGLLSQLLGTYFPPRLSPDLNKRSWLQRCKYFFQTWHKRKKCMKLYGIRHQYDNSNGKSRNILLVREVSINRDECLELCSSQRQ